MTRREFFLASASLVAFRNDTLGFVEHLSKGEGYAEDEDFWMQIRQSFALDPNIVNLNNGGVCPSPRVVQDALKRQLEYGNQAPSYYMWRHLEPEIESVRRRLAKAFGCDAEEMAITRNASEALEICLLGIDLQPGDEVLTTDQDYPRMLTTLRQRERRDGIKLVQVSLPPAPKTHEEVVRAYEQAITPHTKMILCCHVIFMTGAIYPVAELCALGKRKGIPVIVDGAHAFAHFPFTNKDLGAEYYGVSLHKWLLAPVGTGFLHVKKENIRSLWPLMASEEKQSKDIRKFEEIGTHPAANHNAIGEALTFHEMLGGERKAARFRYLRKRWVDTLAGVRGIEFNTNLDPEHSCCLTNVNLLGITPERLAGWLFEKHAVFVTTIKHDRFQGLRVSPNVYTTVSEIDRFAAAMLDAAKNGL